MRWRVPVAAAVLALAGCGTAAPSTAAFRTRAARVCAHANTAGARLRPPATVSDLGTFLRHGSELLRPELAALKTLRPPPSAATSYSAALRARQQELSLLDATAHDLDGGADPVSAIKTLQRRLSPVENDDDDAWRALDIPACVNG
jgi:hypothetical protein